MHVTQLVFLQCSTGLIASFPAQNEIDLMHKLKGSVQEPDNRT